MSIDEVSNVSNSIIHQQEQSLFLSSPPEVILGIFLQLGSQDLFSCRRLCRRAKQIVGIEPLRISLEEWKNRKFITKAASGRYLIESKNDLEFLNEIKALDLILNDKELLKKEKNLGDFRSNFSMMQLLELAMCAIDNGWKEKAEEFLNKAKTIIYKVQEEEKALLSTEEKYSGDAIFFSEMSLIIIAKMEVSLDSERARTTLVNAKMSLESIRTGYFQRLFDNPFDYDCEYILPLTNAAEVEICLGQHSQAEITLGKAEETLQSLKKSNPRNDFKGSSMLELKIEKVRLKMQPKIAMEKIRAIIIAEAKPLKKITIIKQLLQSAPDETKELLKEIELPNEANDDLREKWNFEMAKVEAFLNPLSAKMRAREIKDEKQRAIISLKILNTAASTWSRA